jgi:hypothetical protein
VVNTKHSFWDAGLTSGWLFQRTAGISYLGDFRMTFGENPKKVRNIVDGNLDAFRQLYENKIKVRNTNLDASLWSAFID